MSLDPILEQVAQRVAELVVARLDGQRSAPGTEPDRLLTATELAQRLGCSPRYVYAHAKGYPFTVRQGTMVRFSAAGLERWLARRP